MSSHLFQEQELKGSTVMRFSMVIAATIVLLAGATAANAQNAGNRLMKTLGLEGAQVKKYREDTARIVAQQRQVEQARQAQQADENRRKQERAEQQARQAKRDRGMASVLHFAKPKNTRQTATDTRTSPIRR